MCAFNHKYVMPKKKTIDLKLKKPYENMDEEPKRTK
jgi:hypothetical protein